MKKPRVYISGGMSGIPQKNKPMFDAAEQLLRNNGFDVVNPCNKPNEILDRDSTPQEYQGYMREDLYEMLYKKGGVESIWMLPGWKKSKGAKFEKYVAEFLGIPVYYLSRTDIELGKCWVRTHPDWYGWSL